jgi:DNA-directed RNA polymerase beta' subunit
MGIQELHNALHDLLENTRHLQVQTLALIAKQILAPHQAGPIVYAMWDFTGQTSALLAQLENTKTTSVHTTVQLVQLDLTR